MNLDKKFYKRVALIVAGGILLAFALRNISVIWGVVTLLWGFAFPFVLGLSMAFLLNIPMRAVEKHIFRGKTFPGHRPLSFVLAVLLVLLVIALVLFLVVPELINTIGVLVSNIPGYITWLENALKPLTNYWPVLQDFFQQLNLDLSSLATTAMNALKTGANALLGSAFSVATSVVSGGVSFFIGIIFAGYVLLDKEHLHAQALGIMKAYIPEKRYNQTMSILGLINTTFTKFVTGQCLEAVAVATMFCVVLAIGQFQYALLISVMIGFFSFIPIFGAFIGCFIGAFLILIAQGFWRCLAFVIVFLVLQQIDGNVTYPRIVGTSIGLPPIWVLVAVTIGGNLMGVVGMLIFIPIGSVVYTLMRRDTLRQLKEKGIISPVEELALAGAAAHARKKRRPLKDAIRAARHGANSQHPPAEDAPAQQVVERIRTGGAPGSIDGELETGASAPQAAKPAGEAPAEKPAENAKETPDK